MLESDVTEAHIDGGEVSFVAADDVEVGEDVAGHGAREVVAGLGVVIALGSGAAVVAATDQPATVNDASVQSGTASRRGLVATETRVVSAAPRAFAGQVVTFTAAVAAQELRSALPTGTITFLDGPRELGRTGLGHGGTASLTVTDLTAGDHAVSAVFSGDDIFIASEADPITQRVMRASTVTTLARADVAEGMVVLTARVGSTSASGVAPTGTVSFWAESDEIGTAAVNADGTATVTIAAQRVPDRYVYARYAGDASNRASQSNSAVAANDGIADTATD